MTIRQLAPAALVALVAALLLLLQHVGSERDRAHREAVVAKQSAVVALDQGRLNAASARAVEAAQSRELRITLQAREVSDEIGRSAGADVPVPDGVIRLWAAGVDRLREPTGTAEAASLASG